MSWISLYHLLPYPLKVVAASIQGYRYASWRYGSDLERLVEEALEREHWGSTQWRTWQEERLAFVLHQAATRVPYYRGLWRERRRAGDRASWEVLENWPILEKEPLRQDATKFVADGCDRSRMWHLVTSGTTGTSIDLWWSRETTSRWYAMFEARWRRWYGVTWKDHFGYFGGKMVAKASRGQPPYWVWNSGLRQLYCSSYHLKPENARAYVKALNRHGVKYLIGYSSSLFALATDVIDQSLDVPELSVAITLAEPLYEHQREAISKAFQCPVRETYGMAEVVGAAGECEFGSLHWWPEVGVVEVDGADGGESCQTTGPYLMTGLFNNDMPLIRYRVGDQGALPTWESCACGRALPVLSGLEGRSDDVVILEDGTRVGRFSTVFKGNLPFRGAQVIQESLSGIRVLLERASDYSPGAEGVIEHKLREKLGQRIGIRLEVVDQIPRGQNGKFRAVISRLSAAEKEMAKRGWTSSS